MNTISLIKVLQAYTESSVDEAKEIISLKAEFPYSQFLHVLAARVSKDHHIDGEQQNLQMAAVYTADRSVLKDIITQVTSPTPLSEIITATVEKSKEIDQPSVPEIQTVVNNDINQRNTHEIIDSVDLAKELAFDLKRLNELKNNFEALFINNQKPKQKTDSDNTDTSSPVESAKSKKERIVALAKALNAGEIIDDKTKQKQSILHKSKKERKLNPADELIEEIRESKEEIIPENEKQREQMEIIDQFIKVQPSISGAKDKVILISDLNPIKSGDFNDNVVSETLVDILIKQGKKDKAVEVLKKLIWKYPQKKAHFASMIESLRSS